MTRVWRDRYLTGDGVWGMDLVGGERVAIDEPLTADAGEVDTDVGLAPLTELLAQGIEGVPRWVVLAARTAPEAAVLAQRAAACARRHGYIAVSASIYLQWVEQLVEAEQRTLVIVAAFGTPLDIARAALVAAAARSGRPHVLITFVPPFARVVPPDAGALVREARVAYGPAPGHRADPPGGSRRPAAADAVGVRAGADARDTAPDVLKQLARAVRADEFLRRGRHAAAERLLRDVAGALIRRSAYRVAADVTNRLAHALLQRGRARPADEEFRTAAELAGRASCLEAAAMARAWQAWARADQGRLCDAEALARAVVLTAPAPDVALWARAVLVRCLLEQERLSEAMALPLDVETRRQASAGGAGVASLGVLETALIHDVAVQGLLAANAYLQAGLRAAQAMAATADSPCAAGEIAASTARLRVLCAGGHLAEAASLLAHIVHCCRQSHRPLGAASARVIWCEALGSAGRAPDARDQVRRLHRLLTVVPEGLKRAIDRAARLQSGPAPQVMQMSRAVALSAASLVRQAQDEEDDRAAIRRTLEDVCAELRASRIELVTADAGPATAIISVGGGLATTIGGRILDSGIVIGFNRGARGPEAGVPVRVGTQVLASIAVRWPLDRALPEHGAGMLDIAAAVLAPRVESLLAGTREVAAASTSVPELIGESDAIEEVRRAIGRAARAPFSVLVEGESGVGKELVARAIHHLSARRDRRFCDVNCAALPDDLLESELFGHARGAFTGAVVDRAGLFEEATGGTLFLDEVADLSIRAQAKLLRVVQQQEVRRVGESCARVVDVRLVAAANRDMRDEVGAGRFRPDLLYRLDVIRISIPPLRERPADIPPLARYLWRAAAARVDSRAQLSQATLCALTRYSWPGNVRELQNVMASLAVAAPARGVVRPSLLPGVIGAAGASTSARLAEARAQFERRFVETALARAAGNRTRAAASMGLSRQGLLKRLMRLGLDGR